MVHIRASLIIMMVGAHMGGAIRLHDTPSFFEYGRCAAVWLMDNFHMDQYVGTWYSVMHVPSSYVSVTRCVQDHLSLSGNGLLVKTSGVTSEGAPGSTQAFLTLVVEEDTTKPYLQLRAPFVPPVPYHIVYTDYRNVSCVYSCLGILGIKAELLWVLSRSLPLPHSHLQHCLNIFASQGLNTTKLLQVEQEDCGVVRDVDHVAAETLPDEEAKVMEGVVATSPSTFFSEDVVLAEVAGSDQLDLSTFLSAAQDVLWPDIVAAGNAERRNASDPTHTAAWASNKDDAQHGRHVDPNVMWEAVENDIFNSSTGRIFPTMLLLLGPIWVATLA
ncbi:apolipoprotein D-like isoform X2 [Panulirus ornatus]|uniref:apolipoprotein D-like isoform X2 n=1 Tax=Panulirus ornatus TaxID=150431 RepID=UPI003A8893E3